MVAVYGAPITDVPVVVSFAPGSSALDASARENVGFAAMFMKNPVGVVEIRGHADAEDGLRGERLARKRAEAVRAALIGLGVKSKQLRIGSHRATTPDGSTAPAPSRLVEFITITRPYASE